MQHQSCGSVRLSLYRPTIVALALFNFVSLGNISRSFASDEHVEFLEKGYSLSCYGIESFDFILEAGQLVGEWCRAQNAQLGERGCGEESDMCLEEFIRADRPGYSLSIAVGAAYMNEDISHSGTDIVYGNSRWVRSTDRNRLSLPSLGANCIHSRVFAETHFDLRQRLREKTCSIREKTSTIAHTLPVQ